MSSLGSAESEKRDVFFQRSQLRRQRISRQGLCSKPMCCFKKNKPMCCFKKNNLWPIIKSELSCNNLHFGKT